MMSQFNYLKAAELVRFLVPLCCFIIWTSFVDRTETEWDRNWCQSA